jgi:hypothetical protein
MILLELSFETSVFQILKIALKTGLFSLNISMIICPVYLLLVVVSEQVYDSCCCSNCFLLFSWSCFLFSGGLGFLLSMVSDWLMLCCQI